MRINTSLTMCDEVIKKSEFYKDEEKQKEACVVLKAMRQMRERRSHELVTVKMPNGAVVSTTNPEKLEQYEQYCRRKTGYFAKP